MSDLNPLPPKTMSVLDLIHFYVRFICHMALHSDLYISLSYVKLISYPLLRLPYMSFFPMTCL